MGKERRKMFRLLAVLILAIVAASVVAEVKDVKSLPENLPSTKAAGVARKDILSRSCMNECGGLCRQLCSKFKALKVCNGCVRGCLSKCDVGHGPKITYDPFNLPAAKKNVTK